MGYQALQQLVIGEGLQAVLVPDTSVLIKNPDLSAWQFDFPCAIVISDLVLGEIDTHKQRSGERQTEADSARTVLKVLATLSHKGSLSDRQHLLGGVKVVDGIWCASVPVDRADFPPGLNIKRADDQVASVAWMLRKHLSPVPVVLLTADHGQSVIASAAGIDFFLADHPIGGSNGEALASQIAELAAAPAGLADPLGGYLPRRESIVPMFVGREAELRSLNAWFVDETKQKWALVGDGGKGKSAIAYEFADRVRRLNPGNLVSSVIWMSAKKKRFIEGSIQELDPDFSSLDEALDFVLNVFNDSTVGKELATKRSDVLEWLSDYPALLVVDDIDSVATEDGEARSFFTDDILRTKSKVLFTSRRSLFGMEARQTTVRGLSGDEARQFILTKVREFGLDPARFDENIPRIVDVAEGSPLYIEDLLRLCHVLPVSDAIRRWDRDRGDAARSYSLQREIEELSKVDDLSRPALIACAVANGQVSAAELGRVLDRPMEQVEDTLEHLRHFYLIATPTVVEDVVLFALNHNTRNLVMKEYGATEEARLIRGAFTSLGRLEQKPTEESRITVVCSQARLLAGAGRLADAEALLVELNEKYPNRGVIHLQLGWLYKRWEPAPRVTDARENFRRAEELNVKRVDLYWHWADLEEDQAQYQTAIEIAVRGTDLLGASQSLALREAGARLRLASSYGRHQDRYSAIEELNKALSTARQGLKVPPLFFESPDLKSRLFSVAVRAARRLQLEKDERKLLGDWERELPSDPELARARQVSQTAPGHRASKGT